MALVILMIKYLQCGFNVREKENFEEAFMSISYSWGRKGLLFLSRGPDFSDLNTEKQHTVQLLDSIRSTKL